LRAGITSRVEYKDFQEVSKTDYGHLAFDDEMLGSNLSFNTFSKILAKDIILLRFDLVFM
jgi:hypothetical protein